MSKPDAKGDTYFARSQAGEPEPGGRFAGDGRPLSHGEVPRLPANSPWARDPVGHEPPLGIDINAQVPVGTAKEIEASLARLAQAVAEAEVKLSNAAAMVAKAEEENGK